MKLGIEGGREARFEVQGPMSEVQSPKSKDLRLDVMLRVRHMCVITVIEC